MTYTHATCVILAKAGVQLLAGGLNSGVCRNDLGGQWEVREPFVFFAYLAAVTQRLAFRTSILILPLFPTALVAKQAAELSLLVFTPTRTLLRHGWRGMDG